MGWYYLNVSRLQNAADAAAVAGAQKILTDKTNFSNYKSVALVGKYPGTVSNQYRHSNESELKTITESHETARGYASKNLSGKEDVLINSWTKNEIEHDAPIIYEHDNNLYFVVQLKDTIKHFFLPGWFDDMDAPVTSVAMMSKTAVVIDTNEKVNGSSLEINPPSILDMPNMDFLPDMPFLPSNPLKISEQFKADIENDRNQNVIIGNWEVQNAYKSNTSTVVKNGVTMTQYEAIFGNAVYSGAWNHFQDLYNHYAAGNFYRTQTVTIKDDVNDTDNDGIVDRYGETSSVLANAASINNETNPAVNARETYKAGTSTTEKLVGLPYTWDKLDSINVDFGPEVNLNDKFIAEDWDLSTVWEMAKTTDFDLKTAYENSWINYSNTNNGYKKNWDNYASGETIIRTLRIHTSINFDGFYKVRSDKASPDVLWTRIESEPIIYETDLISDEAKANYKSKKKNRALNSINQIIINANESNSDPQFRPYIIFYDGPETNDIYSEHKNNPNVLHRKSLPVILNLKEPFRAILYAPNSPVVVIGDSKDNFQGFVVAQKYMRLKDDDDFVLDNNNYTNISELSVHNTRTYYAKDDSRKEKPCYKITDENGIEMFVDEHGDIQFADLPAPPTRYGSYDTLGRTNLTTHNYEIAQSSTDNMLLSGN